MVAVTDCFDKDQALPAKYWQSTAEKFQWRRINEARAAFYLGFSKSAQKERDIDQNQ